MNNRLRYMARGLLPVILSAAAVGFLLWNTDQDSPIMQTIASVEDREALLNIYNWADYIDPQILPADLKILIFFTPSILVGY